MRSTSKIGFFFVLALLPFSTLQAESRACAVCGTFYPKDKKKLSNVLQKRFAEAKSFPKQNAKALIVPHAGYVFSADVAVAAYKTLHKKYNNIFIIGSSHYVNLNRVSLYPDNYTTPLGEVKTNKKIIKTLLAQHTFITYNKEAHSREHTLEIQLPFLQYLYGDDLRIVPILLATSDIHTIQKMAKVLQPYFADKKNLFIISSDLSHYPSYKDATFIDKRTLQSITQNSPKAFLATIEKNSHLGIKNLSTSACGWASITLLLELSKAQNYKYEILQYKNSGETPQYGKKTRVVGYGALRIYKEVIFTLNYEEKKELQELAKLALYEAVLYNKRIQIDASKLSPKLSEHLGAFVTLKEHGQLRGCIGRFEPDEPLYEVIIEMAISASRHDNRFIPVTPDELKDIEIESSVLTPRRRVNSVEDVIVGKHGIYVSYEDRNGTYLPQVAIDMGWNAEQFVYSCCVEKAGISPQHCKDAELYVYEAIVF